MKPDNHIKIPRKKLGVLMVNLGTPEKTDFINMWKYLREFLSCLLYTSPSPRDA